MLAELLAAGLATAGLLAAGLPVAGLPVAGLPVAGLFPVGLLLPYWFLNRAVFALFFAASLCLFFFFTEGFS